MGNNNDGKKRQCFWMNMVVPGPQGQPVIVFATCPQTNEDSPIRGIMGCKYWDSEKSRCKIDAAIDKLNESPAIIKPV